MHLSIRLRKECTDLNPIIWLVERRKGYYCTETWEKKFAYWSEICSSRNIYYLEIKQMYADFIASFQNNPFYRYSHNQDKAEIHTDHLELYLIKTHGALFPLGFLKTITPDWQIAFGDVLNTFFKESEKHLCSELYSEQLKIQKLEMQKEIGMHSENQWNLVERTAQLECEFSKVLKFF